MEVAQPVKWLDNCEDSILLGKHLRQTCQKTSFREEGLGLSRHFSLGNAVDITPTGLALKKYLTI